MDFEDLNNVARLNAFLPKRSLSELTIHERYLVTALKQVSTKFGLKVVAVVNSEFQMFLPNRISKAFETSPDLFNELSTNANKYKLFLIPHGEDRFEFDCI